MTSLNPSIDQVFQPLESRLFAIKQGNVQPSMMAWIEDDDDDEIGDYSKRIMVLVSDQIMGVNSSIAVASINRMLKLIKGIKRHIRSLVKQSNLIGVSSKQGEQKLRTELNYYCKELKILEQHFNSKEESLGSMAEQINLRSDFKSSRKAVGSVVLNKYQAGLFFYLLREKNLIRNFSDLSLSTLIGELTGHSAQNIRQDVLGHIHDVLSDKAGKKSAPKNENLIVVKDALQEIINEINVQISRNK